MFLKRIICFFKGHTAYDETIENSKFIDIFKNRKKPDQSDIWINTLSSSSHASAINPTSTTLTNNLNLNTSPAQLVFHDGPFKHNISICKRCHSLYTKRGLNEEVICSSTAIPNIENYRTYLDALEWQKQIHQEKPELEKAYNNYLILLKLYSSGKQNE